MPVRPLKTMTAAMLGMGVLATTPITPLAFAQDGVLEVVVVTAQRREENLQETPISVTALDTTTLDDIRATDIAAIADFTPNLHITPTKIEELSWPFSGQLS